MIHAGIAAGGGENEVLEGSGQRPAGAGRHAADVHSVAVDLKAQAEALAGREAQRRRAVERNGDLEDRTLG